MAVGNLVSTIDRAATDIATLVHENFINEVQPWFSHIMPMAGLFSRIGPKGYTLIGKKLVIARDYTFRGGYMATTGYVPDPQTVDPANLEFTPARCYISGASDNFLEAIAVPPGSFESFADRLVNQMFEAAELGVARHVHGASTGVVALCSSRTDANTIVIKDGYGVTGCRPDMYLEEGMTLAWVDGGATVKSSAKISTMSRTTSSTTATLNFATDIDDGATTIAAGDQLVFASTLAAHTGTAADNYVTEWGIAPLGLLDIIDPYDSLSSYGGLTESSYARINPVRRASSAFGMVELMEFLEEISAKSTSEVTAATHVLTMHPGLKLELAKELLGYQQMSQLGRELQGGWTTVKLGEYDILTDPRHLPSVVYAICPEDLYVVDIGGDLGMDVTGGSQDKWITQYDGKFWFAKWYGNRFAGRRNRLGALTGCTNTNFERYSGYPS